jgi:2-iminobutanoate/2-iminopropanoate deaminase
MNTVYAGYFPVHKPARSSFGTTGLALGARVEIECAALAGK